MIANKFIQIKQIFNNLVVANYSDMDYFIKYNSILAISEKIKEGYILDESQEYTLNNSLKVNYNYSSLFENLFKSNLPEKYIYAVFFENASELLLNKKDDIYCLPLTKNWLSKQDKKILSIEFSKHWIQSLNILLKMNENKEVIHKKIKQINIFKEYLDYLPKENKSELLNFVMNLLKKSSFFHSNLKDEQSDIKSIISLIEKSDTKKEESVNSIKEILFQLKEQNENKVLELLTEINNKFNSIFEDNKIIDIMKKESLTKLYNTHLASNLNQYLNIKKQLRVEKGFNKVLGTAQDLMIETLVDVKTLFELVVKEINEDKLISLSSKKEYFTQLKKQW